MSAGLVGMTDCRAAWEARTSAPGPTSSLGVAQKPETRDGRWRREMREARLSAGRERQLNAPSSKLAPFNPIGRVRHEKNGDVTCPDTDFWTLRPVETDRIVLIER